METKNETLRDYLDRIGATHGDNSQFVLEEEGINTTMEVSRRYLECAAWDYLLDRNIVSYKYPYINTFGERTIKIVVEGKNKTKVEEDKK